MICKLMIQKFMKSLGYKIIRTTPPPPPTSNLNSVRELSGVEKNRQFVNKNRVWNCDSPPDIVWPSRMLILNDRV
jgi:hypothetical protein